MEGLTVQQLLVSVGIPALSSLIVALLAFRKDVFINKNDSYEKQAERTEERARRGEARIEALEKRNDEQDTLIIQQGAELATLTARVSVLESGVHVLTAQLVREGLEPSWVDPGG